MTDDAISNSLGEPLVGITGKDVLIGNFFQNGLRLIIQHSVTPHGTLRHEARRLGQPKTDLFTAMSGAAIRSPGNGAIQGQV